MKTKNSTLTQVSFVTDLELKQKAISKAKKEGVTLKALLVMAMKSYIDDDLQIGLYDKVDFKKVEEKDVNKELIKEVVDAKKLDSSEFLNI